MRNFFISGLILVLFLSCKQSKVNYAIISGKIINIASDTVKISDNFNRIIKKIPIKNVTIFYDTIYNVNGFYIFSTGNEHTIIYLEEGFNLFIELDTKKFDESIRYTGVGSVENNYLAKKYLLDEKLGSIKELCALDEPDFLNKIHIYKSSLEKSLDTNQISDTFKTIEKKNIEYEYVLKLQPFERYHASLTGKMNYMVSDSFPDLLEKEVFNDEKLFANLEAYQQLTIRSFFTKVMNISARDSIPFQSVAIDEVKKLKSELIKNSLLSQLAYQVNSHNDKADDLYKAIMELSTDEKFKNHLAKKYNLSTLLVKGAASPIFDNYENYNGTKTSLADYKGKYVYIDVWATWCGPCIAEIPALKELNEQYKNKNIVFISLSIDEKRAYQVWKKMIKDKDMGGVQLFAPNNWKSDFVQGYGISSIPRFILIDKETKIINPDAPRPSDPNLIKLLDGLDL